jgi:Na+/phosphate symporter
MTNLAADYSGLLEKISGLFYDYLFLPVLKLLGLISPKLAERLAESHVLFAIIWIVILVALLFLLNTLIIIFQRSKGQKPE